MTTTTAITEAVGALTGDRYRDSLRDGRDLWLDGRQVDNVAEHPAFAGSARELARLFDLQHDPDLRDVLTVESPATGNRIGWAYQLPTTIDELAAKWRCAEVWMAESFGQHGRSPAFMASVAVGLYDFRHRLASKNPDFGANAENYYRYCAENDLVLTHALGDPQIDRSANPVEHPDYALHIVDQNADGVVVRGAKQLTTLAPLAHEVLVYLSASFTGRGSEEFVIWFALPMATPGLKILCREPFGATPHGHAHPLAGRFDEQDAMLFFDDVLVPWERVFLLHDGALALEGLGRINAWSAQIGHIRYRQRLRTLLAVATLLAESIGVDGFRNVQDQLGELASYAEMVDYFIDSGHARAQPTDGGLVAPGPTKASLIWSAQVAPRTIEIVRQIGSSGILMQPSENDLKSEELRPYLDRYMHGKDTGVERKSRLFRLCWDLISDSFAQRQDLYEYVHRGDITRNRINLWKGFPQHDVIQRIEGLLRNPF